VQGAVDWLEQNENKNDEEITALAAKAEADDETNPNIEPAALNPGEVAQSLVCNDCKCTLGAASPTCPVCRTKKDWGQIISKFISQSRIGIKTLN